MPIPADNICYPVLMSNESRSSASGFFYRDEKSIYFITAKHVLLNKESQLIDSVTTLICYSKEQDWTKPAVMQLDLNVIFKDNRIKFDTDNDVIVLKVASSESLSDNKEEYKITGMAGIKGNNRKILGVGHKNIRNFSDIIVGNDVYIFGYPRSLGISDTPQIEYEKPLLRKGTIAQKNYKQNTIILDCPVYFGNSGGPVTEQVQVSPNRYEFPVIGVVSQYIPFVDEWLSVNYGYTNRYIENSGYSVVVPMDPIINIIESFRS